MNDVIVNGRGTKSQRGEEVRREWNGEGALGVGGLSLHFCPRAPEFQVTPLAWERKSPCGGQEQSPGKVVLQKLKHFYFSGVNTNIFMQILLVL